MKKYEYQEKQIFALSFWDKKKYLDENKWMLLLEFQGVAKIFSLKTVLLYTGHNLWNVVRFNPSVLILFYPTFQLLI